jgi:hypothetical protein
MEIASLEGFFLNYRLSPELCGTLALGLAGDPKHVLIQPMEKKENRFK